MKKSVVFVLLFVFMFSFVLAENTQQINYSTSKTSVGNSNIVVQVLNYDPYPVNPGSWFDLWVKVQNNGQEDAPHMRFELQPEFPFSSNDSLVRDYGLFYGTINAYRADSANPANQIILKYRIYVADNASDGNFNLKLITSANSYDPSSLSVVHNLPIEIGKTKSDFDVVMQDIGPQGTSFVVTNTGDNKASAVTLSINDQNGVSILEGNKPAVLGDLERGEFTIAHLSAIPGLNTKNLDVKISYTDISGVRSVLDKSIAVQSGLKLEQICKSSSRDYVPWLYGIVGVVVGALLGILFVALKQKRKNG